MPDTRDITPWIAAGLLVLTLITFAGVGSFEFVSLDDPAYVSGNPHVRGGLAIDGLRWSLTTGYWGNWHPLVWWSHMLVAELFGLAPGPHHTANLLLHALCTLLIFGALRRMTGRVWPSALVAALFAVHPLHVESVAWVSARKDTLSSCFWWLTIWLWARALDRPSRRRTALVLLAFGAGLASKSMLVTLPFVLLLFDLWPLRRLPLPGTEPLWTARWRELVVEKLPLFGLAGLAGAIALWAQRGAGALQTFSGTSLTERLGNALVAYATYLRKTLWPVDLAAYYPQVERGTVEILAAGGVLLLISVVALLTVRRVPALLVGWLFYLGTLVPVIGLVQIGAQALADRYTYLPLTGVFVMLVWGAQALGARLPRASLVGGLAATLAIAACIVGTRAQLPTWRDSESLYRRALAVTERNYFIHGMYGAWLIEQGRPRVAIGQLRDAVRIDPRFALGHENLGVVLTSEGRHDEALRHFDEALAVNPRRVASLSGRGVALARAGRLDEAIASFERALEIDPGHGESRRNLARARQLRDRRR